MIEQTMPSGGLTADQIVAKYLDIRQYVERQEAELKLRLQPYRDALVALEGAADKLLRATGQSALQCKGIGTAYYTSWVSITCGDREKFHDYVFATQARHFLTAHVSKEAVLQFMELHDGLLPPGISKDQGVKVVFRKG